MTEATPGSFLFMLFLFFGVPIIVIVFLAAFLKNMGKRQDNRTKSGIDDNQ